MPRHVSPEEHDDIKSEAESDGVKEPGRQGVQEVLEYPGVTEPGPHGVHSELAIELLYDPGEHGLQTSSPSRLKEPVAHGAHVVPFHCP